MDIADIAVIGSGAAATTTLIELFTKLLNDPPTNRKLKITVVEKYPELWKGIPYGSRSSLNSLTITAVPEFISCGKERVLFLDWLLENLNQWASYYRKNGGLAAENWLEINLPLIEKSEWNTTYLPRFVFGIYMHDKMLNLLQMAEKAGLAKLTIIQAEAIDVIVNDGLYKVILEHPDKSTSAIIAKKLVVAIGSAPVRRNAGVNVSNSGYVYINELYEPLLDDNLKALHEALASTSKAEERNVLIIGSNASCIELMYLLNHHPDILGVMNKAVAISRTGRMPCHMSTLKFDEYPCKYLDQIKADGNYNIHSLVEATKKDIQPAIKYEVILPYVDRVVAYTLELMEVLDEESKKMFFGVYGPQLSRLFRRSGPAYKDSSDSLIKAKKLKILKGGFLNVESTSQGGLLKYTNGTNQPKTHLLSFKVVINCSGSDTLQNSSSSLIYNLVQKNICNVNLSGKGFLVNEKFEAAPNLYIIGPLLGGNMNELIHFWHLENVAKLLYLSPYLADILLAE